MLGGGLGCPAGALPAGVLLRPSFQARVCHLQVQACPCPLAAGHAPSASTCAGLCPGLIQVVERGGAKAAVVNDPRQHWKQLEKVREAAMLSMAWWAGGRAGLAAGGRRSLAPREAADRPAPAAAHAGAAAIGGGQVGALCAAAQGEGPLHFHHRVHRRLAAARAVQLCGSGAGRRVPAARARSSPCTQPGTTTLVTRPGSRERCLWSMPCTLKRAGGVAGMR